MNTWGKVFASSRLGSNQGIFYDLLAIEVNDSSFTWIEVNNSGQRQSRFRLPDRLPRSFTSNRFFVYLESFFVDLVVDLIIYLIVYLRSTIKSFFVDLESFFVDLIVDLVVDLIVYLIVDLDSLHQSLTVNQFSLTSNRFSWSRIVFRWPDRLPDRFLLIYHWPEVNDEVSDEVNEKRFEINEKRSRSATR